ncbi:hypothetical protein, partial [uncultured Gammaproteobacteria bacterium]
ESSRWIGRMHSHCCYSRWSYRRTNVYRAWRSPSSASGYNHRSVYKFGGKYYMPSGNL